MKLNENTKFLFIDTIKDKILSFNLENESFVNVLNSSLKIGELVGSCNGIICFHSHNYNIILLNPSIREFKVVPYFKRLLDVDVKIRSVGFGFDALNNDYKVNLISSIFHMEIRKGRPYTYEAAIYSSRSNTWRKLENKTINTISTTSEDITPISSSLFFNGRVHWDAYHSYYDDTCGISDRHPTILSMDIRSETFHEFQYPEAVLLLRNKVKIYSNSSSYQINLQVIRGSLSLIFMHWLNSHAEGEYVDIWSMKEYGIIETWSKQYSIGPFISFADGLSLMENEEEEDNLLVQLCDDHRKVCELVRWNLLKNEEIKRYFLKGFNIEIETLLYSQSLVSIGKNKLDYI